MHGKIKGHTLTIIYFCTLIRITLNIYSVHQYQIISCDGAFLFSIHVEKEKVELFFFLGPI